jgi:PAS domain S-box-containing protein
MLDPTDALQQELAHLRQRVIQLEQQLGLTPSEQTPLDSSPPAIGVEVAPEPALQVSEILGVALDQAAIVTITDAQGRVIYVNDRFCQISQYSREELLGQSLVTTRQHSPEFLDQLWQTITQGQVWTGEIHNRAKDGSSYWVDITIVPFLDQFGIPYQYVAIRHDITARKQMETDLLQLNLELEQRTTDLHRQETRLATIAASIPGTIFQFSTSGSDWKMDYISDRVLDLTGLTAAEVMADMGVLSRCIHPDDRHSYFHSLLKATSTSTAWRYEGRIVKPNGDAWCQGEAVPVQVADNHKVFCGVMLDITDRKTAEAALRQSEAHWQQLFEHSADAIALQDAETGAFLDCNQAALDMHQLPSKDDLIGKTPLDFALEYQPDGSLSAAKTAAIRGQALEQGSHRFEWLSQRTDGTSYWLEVVLTLISFYDKPTFLTIGRDVTNFKQAEAALEESRRFLRLVLDALPNQHIFWKDRNSVYLGCNQLGAQVAGIESAQEIVGKTDYDFSWTEQEADFFREGDRRVMDSNQAELCMIESQHRPEGKIAWLETSKVPLQDAEGRVIGVLVAFQDITDRQTALKERKRTQARLQEQEQFLRSLYEGVNYAVFALEVLPDLSLRYLDMNSVAEHLIGSSSKDYLGKTPAEVLAPEVMASSKQHFETCLATGSSQAWEDYLPFQEAGWWTTTLTPLVDESGNIHRIVGTSINTTDRKRAQAQLQEQEQFLRSIYDGVNYAIFALEVLPDRTLHYLGMNAVAEQSLGVAPKDYLGKTPEQVLAPEIAAVGRQRFEACLEIGRSQTWEDYSPFQGETWWATTLTPLADESGNIHRIVGTSINTTDRKRAEAQLQAQEQFLRSIYDGVACFIFVVEVQADGDFTYLSYNKACAELTGLTNAEIVGKTPEQRFGPAEGALIRQGFQHCLDSATAVTHEECITFGDQTSWFLTTLNPLKGRDGRVDQIVGTAFDVSDLKRAQAQLQQQATDLAATLKELQRTQLQMVQAEKMASLGQLVAGVAHEINNPVNFIFGNLSHANGYTQDLLSLLQLYHQHYPHPDPEVQAKAEEIDLEFLVEDLPKLLNSMKIGADRIQKIVASLRTFSRMDEAEKKAVNIHEGIDSTLMILQHRIKSSCDRAEVHIIKTYGQLPLVECYAGQLNQVFMNLLSNAIDAMEESKTPDPTITIQTCITRKNQLQVSIADNGIGIPEGVRSRLFDPFFTTKPVGKGTGMGLSISYQIVTEKHNGSLKCVSQPDEGATFVVTIPLKVV